MPIEKITDSLRGRLKSFFEKEWGSAQMVSRGKMHQLDQLPGFIYVEDDKILGIITYDAQDGSCEIVSLDSFSENRGIGSSLLNKVIEKAKMNEWNLWLITTNDNTRALHFYQRRGFHMSNVYWNAVDEARKMKPEIPTVSDDGIPILHEIELVYRDQ
ncbi:MAG: GNAT family N-acetyltransferase [Tuberibacillus sp.]